MQSLTTLVPTASGFLALTPRRVAGIVLSLMNRDGDDRSHPKNLRNAAENVYAGPLSRPAGDLMAQAIELMFGERFIARDYRDTVDGDWFLLTRKGKSIMDPQQIEAPATLLDSGNPLVFISCGQYTDSEKAIGRRIADLVEQHTNYVAYFAENQRSFEGLSTSILAALNKMSGMVVVMHRRGEILARTGTSYRGSLWVEQEIAIAAALQHLGRKIPVAAYVQDGIKREGLRELLHLNPLTFTSEDEIAKDFEHVLKTGGFVLETVTTHEPNVHTLHKYSEKEQEARSQSRSDSVVPHEGDGFEDEISEAFHDAAGQGGLLILSYVCSIMLAVHPAERAGTRFGDDELRGIIEGAKIAAGASFPIASAHMGVNMADGFAVTTYPRVDGPHQYREYYRFRRDGLFVGVQVSPDDIKDDRQYRESDRFIGFSTLVATLTRMGRFAAALAKAYDEETRVEIRLSGLANHRLVDDTADQMLVLGNLPVAHEDRVERSLICNASKAQGEIADWSVSVISECLRLLNYPYTTDITSQTVRNFQARVR